MYDVEFYDSHVGRKMAVNMGRTGELTMTVDEWEKFCRLMLFEISRDREKNQPNKRLQPTPESGQTELSNSTE